MVAAQAAEVTARYGANVTGAALSPDTLCLLARLDGGVLKSREPQVSGGVGWHGETDNPVSRNVKCPSAGP